MSANLRELMETAAARPSRPVDAERVWHRGRRRLWARRAASAVVAASLLVGAWAAVSGDVFSARDVQPARRTATVTRLRAYGQDVVVAPDGVWFSDRMGELVRVDAGTNARTAVVAGMPTISGGTIEVGGGALWTMAWNGTITGSGRARGAIQRVDLSKLDRSEVRRGKVLASFDDVGANVAIPRGDHAPADAAYAFGGLWVADTADDEIWRVDERTGRVTERIPVGGAPVDVEATAERVWVLRGNIRGEETPETALVPIDPAQDSPDGAAIPVGDCANRIAADARSVWVSDWCTGVVRRYDDDTSDVTMTASVGGGVFALRAGGGALWALNDAGGPTVTRVDADTARVTRFELPAADDVVGSQMAYGHGSLWIAGGNQALRVDVSE